jgi:hypothetical protein
MESVFGALQANNRQINKTSCCLSRQRLASPTFAVKLLASGGPGKSSMHLIRALISPPGEAEWERKRILKGSIKIEQSRANPSDIKDPGPYLQ